MSWLDRLFKGNKTKTIEVELLDKYKPPLDEIMNVVENY